MLNQHEGPCQWQIIDKPHYMQNAAGGFEWEETFYCVFDPSHRVSYHWIDGVIQDLAYRNGSGETVWSIRGGKHAS